MCARSSNHSWINVRARHPLVSTDSVPTQQEVDVHEKTVPFYEIMMKRFLNLFVAVILLSQQCTSLPLEETVVSVYTTHPTTMGTNPPIDVYHQIANNLAERITSPIYNPQRQRRRFLGINGTKPESTTKGKIEIQDDQDIPNKRGMNPIDNDITKDRDVEELSVEGLNRQSDKKPEKITIYSSYLPALAKSSQFSGKQVEAKNDTWNELEDPFNWDDDEPVKAKEGPIIYVLELLGSIFQLVWGGLTAIFKPNSSRRDTGMIDLA